MRFLLLLILCNFADPCAASDLEEFEKFYENKIRGLQDKDIQELSSTKNDFRAVDKLNQFQTKTKELEPIKKDSDFIEKGKDYRLEVDRVRKVFLLKGTRVFNLDDNKAKLLTRDIHANTFRKDNVSQWLYLLNNKGQIKYMVSVKDIIQAKEILNLHKQPDKFEVVNQKESLTKIEKQLAFQTQFKVGFEAFDPTYLNDFDNPTQQQGQGYGSRLELTSNLSWNFPILLGASLGFNKALATYTDETEKTINSFYIGPFSRIKITDFEESSLFFIGGYQRSIRHRVQNITTSKSYDFTMESILLGLEFNQAEREKGLVWGIDYRFNRFSYNKYEDDNNSGDQVGLDSSAKTSASLTLFLGYQFDLIL